MRLYKVLPEEENRIDRFIIRAWGIYDWTKIQVLRHFNPSLDLLLFKAGESILVPDDKEMTEVRNYKGFYSLVRN